MWSAAALEWLWTGYAHFSPECKQYLQQATTICAGLGSGFSGFASLRLAWGWLLLGFVAGFFLSVCLDSIRRRRLQAQPSWRDLVLEQLAISADAAQREVLQYLADGGVDALNDLATTAGMPPMRLLGRVLAAVTNASTSQSPAAVSPQPPLAALLELAPGYDPPPSFVWPHRTQPVTPHRSAPMELRARPSRARSFRLQ